MRDSSDLLAEFRSHVLTYLKIRIFPDLLVARSARKFWCLMFVWCLGSGQGKWLNFKENGGKTGFFGRLKAAFLSVKLPNLDLRDGSRRRGRVAH